MIDKLKAMMDSGIHFPYAYDPVEAKPSITLLFPYVTFILAVISLIALHFRPELLTATLTSIAFWGIAVVFYRLRKIDKLKFNLRDQSVEVGGDSENTEEKESTDAAQTKV